MKLHELINEISTLVLQHKQIESCQTGNVFDIATSKSSEVYPAVWIELPVFTNYIDRRKKSHSFSINFLSLCKSDDLDDAIQKTSDMEVIADEVLQALDDRFTTIGISEAIGLTLRNFSDDDLVGIRVELQWTVGRECDYRNSFDVK